MSGGGPCEKTTLPEISIQPEIQHDAILPLLCIRFISLLPKQQAMEHRGTATSRLLQQCEKWATAQL